MMTLATIAIGTNGGFEVISQRIQSGAAPPGAGSSITASPPQTKLTCLASRRSTAGCGGK